MRDEFFIAPSENGIRLVEVFRLFDFFLGLFVKNCLRVYIGHEVDPEITIHTIIRA